jgi:MFS family permease
MASFGTLFAPALGGILVSTSGFFWPFVIDAFSFWLLALVFLGVNLNRPAVQHQEGEKLKALDGLKFVFGDRLIRALVILVGVLIIVLGSFNVGEVFLVKDELKASDLIYGLVGAMFAGGSIIGAVLTAAVKLNRRFHAIATVVGISVLVLTVFGFSLTPNWGIAMGLALATGIGNSILNAYAISIIMTRAPQDMLGRVNASIGAVIQTGSVLGIVLSGIAIQLFTVRPVLFVCGILAAVVVAIFGPDVIRYGRSFTDDDGVSVS